MGSFSQQRGGRIGTVQYCTDVRTESLENDLGMDSSIRHRASLDGQGEMYEAITFSTRTEDCSRSEIKRHTLWKCALKIQKFVVGLGTTCVMYEAVTEVPSLRPQDTIKSVRMHMALNLVYLLPHSKYKARPHHAYCSPYAGGWGLSILLDGPATTGIASWL